jgi:hypothetical protein
VALTPFDVLPVIDDVGIVAYVPVMGDVEIVACDRDSKRIGIEPGLSATLSGSSARAASASAHSPLDSPPTGSPPPGTPYRLNQQNSEIPPDVG